MLFRLTPWTRGNEEIIFNSPITARKGWGFSQHWESHSSLETREQPEGQPNICPCAFSLPILKGLWCTRHWAIPWLRWLGLYLVSSHTKLILATVVQVGHQKQVFNVSLYSYTTLSHCEATTLKHQLVGSFHIK